MASPAELAQTAPETLPPDFAEWDSEEPPATLPANFKPFEAASKSGSVSKPPMPAQTPMASHAAMPMASNGHKHLAPPAQAPVELLTPMPSASPKPSPSTVLAAALTPAPAASAKPAPKPAPKATPTPVPLHTTHAEPRVTAAPVVVKMRNTSAVTPAIVHTDDETLFRSLRSYGLEAPSLKPETEHEEKTKNKLILPAVGIGSLVLLAVMVGVIYHATHLTTTAVVTHPVQTEEIVNAPQKPSPVTLPAPVQPAPQPAAPVVRQQSTNPGSYQPAPHVESDLMADQLTEPTRIPSDIKKVQPKETPPAPGFGVPGMDGLGSGAIGSVFSGPGKPKQKVEPSKVVSISAGVAVGLLLQKTNPVYPPIAKAARVAGTVELQATISKSGTIENLRVVSGPDMLRQSAMDAVRSWRYRPYKLNNEPVEVETTVDVIFALGR